MASVKQLKSKGKAGVFTAFHERVLYLSDINPAYAYRKAAFASLPPAKIVKPVRALRRSFEQAVKVWDRELTKAIEHGWSADAISSIKFPTRERGNWLFARSLNGRPGVNGFAAACLN